MSAFSRSQPATQSRWGKAGWGRGTGRGPDCVPRPLPGPLPQLAQEARNIYEEFLSSQALSPVNIDRQAWLGEEVLAQPRPDMFRAQQLQVSGAKERSLCQRVTCKESAGEQRWSRILGRSLGGQSLEGETWAPGLRAAKDGAELRPAAQR